MAKNAKEEKFEVFQIVIIVLSIYVLLSLIVSTFFPLPAEVLQLLELIDNCICLVFLIDFIVRFYKAPDKLNFMKWGWIDLVSSIPALNYFRAGRLVRLIRLFRLLRAFRSTKVLIHYVFKKKTQGAFTTVALIAILMVIFSSISILQVEKSDSSNIKSAEDALWWSYTTITTVGYGDKYPVTTEGRMIGVLLMTVGVGLFGTFTGYVATWFLKAEEEQKTT